jgi:UDPglucose--hexose-1-phosphate uridylyltransferase
MPEIRKDPFTGRLIIFSAERAKRPQPVALDRNPGDMRSCPFCAGNEAMTPPEVFAYGADPNQIQRPGWIVRVVPNKYPALVSDGNGSEFTDGIYESMNGLGVHEVIIESPNHVENMAMLSENQIEQVLLAYRERMLHLRRDKRWRYILLYKNQGIEAGATLPHVHSQLIALPWMPKEVADEMTGAQGYFESTGDCLYCEMIRREIRDRNRIVAEHERWVVLCPYASRFSYEAWILPRKHVSNFDASSKDDFAELSRVLRQTLIRLNRQLTNPPFNYTIHSSPLGEAADGFYHWHMEIMPKLTQVAAFELGSGSYINPVAPEDAARLLRKVAYNPSNHGPP